MNAVSGHSVGAGDTLTTQHVLLAHIVRTDQHDRPLPAHRRGTLGGMDAATELAGTYLQRVLRWWVGKGPAAMRRLAW
ncbi:hypothetical protein DGN11_03350 [Xanthomonas citri pv. fuscans]|nr:hypothetical protein DGN11_03350 [Xanthomonas citri pv. fuscans]